MNGDSPDLTSMPAPDRSVPPSADPTEHFTARPDNRDRLASQERPECFDEVAPRFEGVAPCFEEVPKRGGNEPPRFQEERPRRGYVPQDVSSEPLRFQLSSLLLTTALIASCLAVARVEPLLGILLVVVGGPAYIRTALAARRACGDYDLCMSSITVVLVFAESLLVVLLLAATMLVSFAFVMALSLTLGFLAELAVGSVRQGPLLLSLILGLLLAILSSVTLTGWLGLRLWPVRWRPANAAAR